MQFNEVFTEDRYLAHLDWLTTRQINNKLNLSGANLKGINLRGANLKTANLANVDFTGANLSNVNLINANLRNANLTGANLVSANLSNSSLFGANLTEANLDDINLTGANLTKADLTNADLTNILCGNGEEIKTIQLGNHKLVFTDTQLAIGCKQYSYVEWFNFDKREISRMDYDAWEYWQINKSIIFQLAEHFEYFTKSVDII
jgi:uncharacterized protein YjbI with pentapeptide repeats